MFVSSQFYSGGHWRSSRSRARVAASPRKSTSSGIDNSTKSSAEMHLSLPGERAADTVSRLALSMSFVAGPRSASSVSLRAGPVPSGGTDPLEARRVFGKQIVALLRGHEARTAAAELPGYAHCFSAETMPSSVLKNRCRNYPESAAKLFRWRYPPTYRACRSVGRSPRRA